VILADLRIGTESFGPHLFWARIASRDEDGVLTREQGVEVSSVPQKTALRGLDNAIIDFTDFVIPRSALLSRFSSVSEDGTHGNARVRQVC